MPTYEYQCNKCGTFEVSQRITESPLRRCPTCRGKVTKLISQTSFQLKGSGWYVTDYASKGSGKKEGAAGDSGKSEGSSSSESGSKASDTAKSEPAKSEAVKSSSKDGTSKTEAAA